MSSYLIRQTRTKTDSIYRFTGLYVISSEFTFSYSVTIALINRRNYQQVETSGQIQITNAYANKLTNRYRRALIIKGYRAVFIFYSLRSSLRVAFSVRTLFAILFVPYSLYYLLYDTARNLSSVPSNTNSNLPILYTPSNQPNPVILVVNIDSNL